MKSPGSTPITSGCARRFRRSWTTRPRPGSPKPRGRSDVAEFKRDGRYFILVILREGGGSTSFYRATDANSWMVRLRGPRRYLGVVFKMAEDPIELTVEPRPRDIGGFEVRRVLPV